VKAQVNGRAQTTVGTNARAGANTRSVAHATVLRDPTFASRSPGNATPRALANSTFRGHFAQSALAEDWRHHRHHRFFFGFVIGFVGPLFWPYAYDDFIDYAFWPYAYDTFWPYAFDDTFAGIYGGYAPEYYAPDDAYAYAGAPTTGYAYAARVSRGPAAAGGNYRICTGQPTDLVNFPIERIREQVAPDQNQERLLDDLKAATAKAVDLLQAACPSDLPSTPPGRMAAMRDRITAMLKAVQVVRPALDAFYQSLSDEQKERFNSLDQNTQAARASQPDVARLCGGGRTALNTSLPVSRIEQTLNLSADQDADLKSLNEASAKAGDLLKASCQPNQSLTPTGRLAAMEERLTAVLQAIDTVQPELARFYNSLKDEQKARFDRLSVRA
jgi:LTXXQ motif family protein